MEILIGLLATAITGGAGWVGYKLKRHWALPDKVDQIEQDVKYVREKFDDFLISAASRRD